MTYNDPLLFHERKLDNFLAGRKREALALAGSLSADDFTTEAGKLDPSKVAELASQISATISLDPLVIDFAALHRTPVSEVDGILGTSVVVPFTGAEELLRLDANHYSVKGDARGSVVTDEDGKRLVFWVRSADLARDFDQLLGDRRALIESKADWTNELVRKFNENLAGEVKQAVEERCQLLQKIESADTALAVPVRRSRESAIPLPVTRRELRPRRVSEPSQPSTAASEEPVKWVLEDSVYEDVLRTLQLFALAAGRLPRSTSKLDEADYRNFALMVLNSNFETSAARGEVFNGDGKTDLLVPWEGGNAFIGEFKLYDGPQSVAKALTQLLTYMTWHDSKGALVIIIDRADASAAIRETYSAVENHPRVVSALAATDPDHRRDFVVASSVDSARRVRVAVIPIVVASAQSATDG